MKLDASAMRYLTNKDWQILTAIELAMRNHEYVPIALASSISKLPRALTKQHLSHLLKHKLLAHDGQSYDGYKLTYLGYDFLALRTLVKRGHLVGVGMRIGVGKESDIHICQATDGRTLCLKLHRLGRISFRTIKRNRDYLGPRQSASWIFLARLAALKEFAYMKALEERNFPVPKPIDVNRHAVLMEYVDATPLSQIKGLGHPTRVLENAMRLIVKFAKCGLIHGDFNEFNLLIDDQEKLTVIDFPQLLSTSHENAAFYFARDTGCIKDFFQRRFRIEVTTAPEFSECANLRHSGGATEELSDRPSVTTEGKQEGELSLFPISKHDEANLERALMCMSLDHSYNADTDTYSRSCSEEHVNDTAGEENSKHSELPSDESDQTSTTATAAAVTTTATTATVAEGGVGTDVLSDTEGSEETDDSGDDTFDKNTLTDDGGQLIENVWRPKIKRPNTTKVRHKARRKQREACGGGLGNMGQSKNRENRKINFQLRLEV